ncbi:prohibitin family protein [Gloeobacter kilaueensis]|uniref:SPFH/Band 7/PHB domain protein n=1 Tax=Gloeobacter kilaueensis (strain ATCC BAA-2537 / CCAP 1431/1 / ULC 316 / JS1) TaxID=1183438 RepID=U5QKK1_GLOK1|nr:prohibitin family protein [Gloeobacter kilaueensis]AGY58215.1 SPFH/Band 7/PHB domain protein [Gloeobacter kilaueensis JS1]
MQFLKGEKLAIQPIVPIVAGVVIAVLLVLNTWTTVQPGYVGIVFDKITHDVRVGLLEPGWVFINPLTESIQQYPVTIQTYSMVQKSSEGQVAGDDSIKIQSNEGQQLNLDAVIQYQVNKSEAARLYEEWGGASIETIEDRVVRQYTRSEVPQIAARYGWEEITSSRRSEIIQKIAARLSEEFQKRHLVLVSFAIREVHLPAVLQQALNQKIEAQQQAEKQRYTLQQTEIQAEQAKVEAQGKAAAILIRAKAQADANSLLSRSLTPELLRSQQIEKWNGILPSVTGSGALPILDLEQRGEAKK